MLISSAWAFDAGVADTGSSGGGIALLVILVSGITLYTLYSVARKWRRRKLDRENGGG